MKRSSHPAIGLLTAMNAILSLIVFGPEGGISESEVAALKNFGAVFTSLGPRILRTETAPLYALAAISCEYE